MTPQDWIALLSFLGALLSAVYARWTYNEAKKSNQIAIHTHQKEIFNSFINYKGELIQLGEQVGDDTLYKLAVASFTSDFYLPEDLAIKLKEYSNLAHKINFEYKRTKSFEKLGRDLPEGMWDDIFSNTDKCHELEKPIEAGLRDVLTLAKP